MSKKSPHNIVASHELQKRIQEITNIVESWPIDVELRHVLNWVMQFDAKDYDIPLRVLSNLVILGPDQITDGLKIAYSKLQRNAFSQNTSIDNTNTLFSGLTEAGKSGQMIAYYFRMVNEVSEHNYIDENTLKLIKQKRIKNIVLLDDIIGTGNQAVDKLTKIRTEFFKYDITNFFVISIISLKTGVDNISNKTGATVSGAFEFDSNDSVMSFDSRFYDGLTHVQKQSLFDKIKKYGEFLDEKHPFGYQESGLLVTFFYNTPNNSLPIIWSSEKNWIPLFRRSAKIKSIEGWYNDLKETDEVDNTERNEIVDIKDGENLPEKKVNRDLRLITSSKRDNEFVQYIIKNRIPNTEDIAFNPILLGDQPNGNLLEVLFSNDSNPTVAVFSNSLRNVRPQGDSRIVYFESELFDMIDFGKMSQVPEGLEWQTRLSINPETTSWRDLLYADRATLVREYLSDFSIDKLIEYFLDDKKIVSMVEKIQLAIENAYKNS